MTSSTRPLLLASLLLVAAACADADTPLGAAGRDSAPPAAAPKTVLAVLTCTVNVRTGTEACAPAQPGTGGALGGLIAIGNATQITLITSNKITTADSVSFDRTVTNNIYQALGTVDGVTADAAGVRVWLEPPRITDTTVVGQPASVTVANADGTLTYKTYTNRPYFQYPGLLQPGATSTAKHWKFTTVNVDAFSYVVYVLSEVQHPLGKLWITPSPVSVLVGTNATLAAHVRDALKLSLDPVTWTSSDPSVVTVTELTPVDSLAQITGVAQGTAWIRAVSNHPRLDYAAARVDSVFVSVN